MSEDLLQFILQTAQRHIQQKEDSRCAEINQPEEKTRTPCVFVFHVIHYRLSDIDMVRHGVSGKSDSCLECFDISRELALVARIQVASVGVSVACRSAVLDPGLF